MTNDDDEAATPQASGAVVETCREWRLHGQPDGDYPFYDMTFSDRDRVEALMTIWQKIQSGERRWTDAKFQSREVTITRTPWRDEL